jgi:hypothetical protein
MGSEKVKSDVVFDTGSGWLTVTTRQCRSCTYPRYDPTISQYSRQMSNETKTLSVSINSQTSLVWVGNTLRKGSLRSCLPWTWHVILRSEFPVLRDYRSEGLRRS